MLRQYLKVTESSSKDDYQRLQDAVSKQSLGEVGERNIKRLIGRYITSEKKIFEELILHTSTLNDILVCFMQLDIELTSIELELGIKLDDKKLSTLIDARYSTFINYLKKAEGCEQRRLNDFVSLVLCIAKEFLKYKDNMKHIHLAARIIFLNIKNSKKEVASDLTEQGDNVDAPEKGDLATFKTHYPKLELFLAKNHKNLKSTQQDNGYGCRLFVGHRDAVGPKLLSCISTLMNAYVEPYSIFKRQQLNPVIVDDIYFIYMELANEVLLTAKNIGLKLDKDDQHKLVTAYYFAVTSCLNAKADPKSSPAKQAPVFGLTSFLGHIGAFINDGLDVDSVLAEAKNKFADVQIKLFGRKRSLSSGSMTSKIQQFHNSSMSDFKGEQETTTTSNSSLSPLTLRFGRKHEKQS